jgi:molybdenum cofactor cytidylyltransferase
MISAIVLAAGASVRMGSPKALLKISGKTFLQHIVDVLASAGVHDVVLVLGANADVIKRQLDWFRGTVVTNNDWNFGMLSSVIAGLGALGRPDIDGALFCPVDHPLITKEIVEGMVQAFSQSHKQIVIPTYQGRRGHPVLFHSSLFPELIAAPMAVGARAVVHNHEKDLAEMATEDEGVIINIDTPEDYAMYCPR